MPGEIVSLITRRADLYHFTPNRGRLLEIGPTSALEDFTYGYALPQGFKNSTFVAVEPDNLVGLTTIRSQFETVVILPGPVPTEQILEHVPSLLSAVGWVSLAAEHGNPEWLLNKMQQLGLEPIMAIPWQVGDGVYVFGRTV